MEDEVSGCNNADDLKTQMGKKLHQKGPQTNTQINRIQVRDFSLL